MMRHDVHKMTLKKMYGDRSFDLPPYRSSFPQKRLPWLRSQLPSAKEQIKSISLSYILSRIFPCRYVTT